MATATEARPSAPSATPAGHSKAAHSSSSTGKPKFDFIKLDGLQHYLKLRTKLPITDRLSAEVGADYNVSSNDALPQAAVFYEVFRGQNKFATLRLSLDRLAIRKPFNLQREKFGLRLNATAATTFDGRPDIGFDVDNVRPAWVLLIPATILLLAGKPLSGTRSFGNVRAKLPAVSEDAVFKAEGLATLSKKGRGLQFGLSQANAVLRL